MTARLEEVSRAGLTFDVTDGGPEDGTPVVLLHGFPERRGSWSGVAALLHDAGLRTFAVDQRGYSPRARPPRRRDYTLDRLADDAVAVVEQVRRRTSRPVHLVGHDWGAVVAWVVAARRPSPVASLTAFSVPHPAAYARAGLRSAQLLKSWYMLAFNVPGLAERLAREPGGQVDRLLTRSGMTAEEVARFRADVVEDGALTGGLQWYRALPLSAGALSVGRVRIPTTFCWSDGDAAVDRWGAEHCADFVAEGTDYRFEVLEGVSHWIPTQAADAAARLVVDRVGTR